MLKSLRRNQLVKKGMACSKTRRRRAGNELTRRIESSPGLRLGILLAFAALLLVLTSYGGGTDTARRLLLALLIFGTALAQLRVNHPEILARNSRLFLVLGVIFTQLAASKLLLLVGRAQENTWQALPYLAIPYAFAPLTLSVLLGKNLGMFAAIFSSLLGSILLYNVDSAFLIISLISGFVAVYVTLQVRRRSRLVRAGLYAGLAIWALAVAFGVIGPILPHNPAGMDWGMIAIQTLTAVGAAVVTASLIGGILPVFESVFDITTDISWLEAADLNHPLLTEMSLKAPGTYYHSMSVAQLAEAAAEAIGANETVCRVGSYFHDIGKLVKPEYFCENQSTGRNPHDELTPTMSALIIMAHVKEGVDLALKHRLNPTIIDIIQQHHGTSLVTYFYHRGLQQQDDARRGGKIMNMREEDIPEVDEQSFRYSGPRPQFPEAAIISLADSVESASRSMARPTPQRIDQLINDIIDSRIADHQLDESHLTLNELREIAESFRSTLLSMMHNRIAYSREEPSAENAKPAKLAGSGPGDSTVIRSLA